MSELQVPSETEGNEEEMLLLLQECREKGRDLRKKVPRSSQKLLNLPDTRPDPISLLQAQDKKRLKQLLPIKYGRMLASPFAFLRGAAAIMAYDLATTPVTGLQVQLCGDAHLLNFGIFATPERKLVFDINDFDETYPGPWEWDLKRLATSAVLAGRDRGFKNEVNKKLARTVGIYYQKAMLDFSQTALLDIWYYHVEIDELHKIIENFSEEAEIKLQNIAMKARKRTQAQTVDKLTEVIHGRRRIRNNPPLLTRLNEMIKGKQNWTTKETNAEMMIKEEQAWVTKEKNAEKLFNDYLNSLPEEMHQFLSHFRISDGAFRVGGVGSVGTRCLIYLLEGIVKDETLILQLKEAGQSVLEPYVEKKDYINQAQRVVIGQKLIQANSDIFLGWIGSELTGTPYYWRQLKDMKGSVNLTALNETVLEIYLKVCSICLAKAHARTGNAASISGYIGKNDTFINAVTDFSMAYADQTEHDYAALKDAVKTGKIEVKTGI